MVLVLTEVHTICGPNEEVDSLGFDVMVKSWRTCLLVMVLFVVGGLFMVGGLFVCWWCCVCCVFMYHLDEGYRDLCIV